MKRQLSTAVTLSLLLITACSEEPGKEGSEEQVDQLASVATSSDKPQSAQIHLAGQETGSEDHPGREVFGKFCANCHMGGVARAAHVSALRMLPYHSMLRTLNDGIMTEQTREMTAQQRDDVAFYLTGGPRPAVPMPPQCGKEDATFDFKQPPFAPFWGITADNRRFIEDEAAQFSRADLEGLELKWAFAYPHANRARSQPSFVGGSLIVGSQDGTVYSLDADTGCIRWTFNATAEVRTGMTLTNWDANQVSDSKGLDRPPMAYFADILARTYAINVVTGELIWSTKVDDHPNATTTAQPTLFEGVVYQSVSSLEVVPATDPRYECCTFRGSLVALDGLTGEVIWKTETITEPLKPTSQNSAGTMNFGPSGAPIWNTATVDPKRRLLYAGTGENYSSPAEGSSDAIIAFSIDTGKIVWKRQTTAGDAWNVACVPQNPDKANCPVEVGPDVDFAAPSILISDGEREILVAGQKSGVAFGINPDNGALIWTQPVGRGGTHTGGIHFGMATNGELVFVPIGDDDDGVQPMEDANPGLYGLDAYTGEIKWSQPAANACGDRLNCAPGASSPATALSDLVIQGYMDGMLRVHDGATGEVLWQFDTDREFATISGATAHGGSFSGGSGTIVHKGRMYANSGYGIYNHMPGNVLLVFGK
jgi:polyvinyl alcohol dehydrogenase (cytochrome)